MKDERTVDEQIAGIRRLMQIVSELEAVRRKYGELLRGSDTVNVTMSLENLEIAVYGSFANMVETRLRYLEAEVDQTPAPEYDFDAGLWLARLLFSMPLD